MDQRWLAGLGLASILALFAAPLACGSSDTNDTTIGDDGGAGDDGSLNSDTGGGTTGDDGSASGDDGATTGDDGGTNGDGAGGDAGPTCGALQATCSANADCCSHLCLGSHCVASITTCGATGAHCGVSTDCCNGSCVNGTCGATQCVTIGAACPTSGNTCCTDTCVNNKCAAIGGGTTGDAGTADGGGTVAACVTAGNVCSANSQCCSGLCTSGRCDIASSYCIQNNDMCFHAADCCGGVCTAPNGQPVTASNPGLCSTPQTGGVNCTGVDGTLCDPTQVGCAGGCCSHLCAPYGPTGVAICTQAQGCHVEGDLCRKDSDCCGGEPADAGILGAGLVTCQIPAGGTIGVCSTPTSGGGGNNACVPAGDVCHYDKNNDPSYTCSSSAARADCCDGQTPNKALCQLDKLGVPRCLIYTGDTDAGAFACRQTGQTCATAADCCNGDPCVPNSSGQLVCGATTCIPTSGSCTSNADCCTGNQCVIPVGSLQGTCYSTVPPSTSPDGGTTTSDGGSTSNDGGSSTSDAGTSTCALYGQSCTTTACCSGTVCSGGICTVIR